MFHAVPHPYTPIQRPSIVTVTLKQSVRCNTSTLYQNQPVPAVFHVSYLVSCNHEESLKFRCLRFSVYSFTIDRSVSGLWGLCLVSGLYMALAWFVIDTTHNTTADGATHNTSSEGDATNEGKPDDRTL